MNCLYTDNIKLIRYHFILTEKLILLSVLLFSANIKMMKYTNVLFRCFKLTKKEYKMILFVNLTTKNYCETMKTKQFALKLLHKIVPFGGNGGTIIKK